MTVDGEVEDLLRRMAPQVLGALVRRYGNFDTAEDAVQEALLAAATQWPADGVPAKTRSPGGSYPGSSKRPQLTPRLRTLMTPWSCWCCAVIRPSMRRRRLR